jgi:hypothetical protein
MHDDNHRAERVAEVHDRMPVPGEAPGQNFIGRIERGFDFLGYRAHPLRRLAIGVPRFLL